MSNNLVILQGWLHLCRRDLVSERLDGQDVAYLRGRIDTDKVALGGRHHVVLVGEALEKASRMFAMSGGDCLRVQAVVKGRLVTYGGRSVVQSADVTLIPAEAEVVPSSA